MFRLFGFCLVCFRDGRFWQCVKEKLEAETGSSGSSLRSGDGCTDDRGGWLDATERFVQTVRNRKIGRADLNVLRAQAILRQLDEEENADLSEVQRGVA